METKIIDKLEEAFTPEQIPTQMELPKAPQWYYLKYFTKEAQLYRKSVDKYILSTSTHIEIQKYLLDKKCKSIISAIVLLLTTFFDLMPFLPNVFNPNWFGLNGDVYNWTDKIIITLMPSTFGLANWSITKIPKYGKVIKIINRLIPWIILIYWFIKTLTKIFFHNTKCEECKKSKNDGDLE
ncbi:MAG: hypothetical protein OHM56_08040 [Spiroplasma phoeniceum]|nr:MAG: hypothetical protein OHM57_07440 [Spiroplasma phoeniceum]UZQ31577.1 MAG: hypothetical protein OHM56_08040 [Spiroplasma phoeniceum]